MRHRRTLVIGCAIIALAGCEKGVTPLAQAQSGNAELAVEKIATIEKCNVYRFADYGYFRYVTICPNADASTTNDESHSNGKVTVIVPKSIDTIRRKQP